MKLALLSLCLVFAFPLAARGDGTIPPASAVPAASVSTPGTAAPARIQTALVAAGAVYHLPNLRTGVEAAEYFQAFAAFLEATPAGYEVWGADADLATGLKFVIYKPLPSHPEGEGGRVGALAHRHRGRDRLDQ